MLMTHQPNLFSVQNLGVVNRHPLPVVAFLLATALLGCAKHDELMPMKLGKTWTYTVRPGFGTLVEPVKAIRQVPVGDGLGYELAGPLGVSRMAWQGTRLITDMAGNARFVPPIPLLGAGDKSLDWRGWLETNGKKLPAKASLTEASAKLSLAGRDFSGTRSTLKVKTPAGELVLDTWFAPGVGVVQQEQRTNDKLDLQLQLLND